MGLEAAQQSMSDIRNPGEVGLDAGAPLLDVKGLSVRFDGAPKGVNVVDDVSFGVEEGTMTVVVGTSGAGKSTLLRMINRLVEPSAGRVLIS